MNARRRTDRRGHVGAPGPSSGSKAHLDRVRYVDDDSASCGQPAASLRRPMRVGPSPGYAANAPSAGVPQAAGGSLSQSFRTGSCGRSWCLKARIASIERRRALRYCVLARSDVRSTAGLLTGVRSRSSFATKATRGPGFGCRPQSRCCGTGRLSGVQTSESPTVGSPGRAGWRERS